ncbi:MAG: signal peptidase II [Gemmatimonadaceae bacterium]
MNRGPLDRLAVSASLLFIADFATKQWALRNLAAEPDGPRAAGWHLAVVNNTHLAGGMQNGGFELPLTALLTTIVAILVLRVCRQLAAIDATAPMTLGLLLGSGAANLADALLPPSGVVDFIAFTTNTGATVSFNVADVALAIALILCLRMMWRIAETMGGRSRPRAVHHYTYPGALPMRDRLLLSAGHALLAMCGFVWLYSMAIALTPDAGRSAPNSLLCGVGVFALTFVASQARLRLTRRRVLEGVPVAPLGFERVVLDGSVVDFPRGDTRVERPGIRRPRIDIVGDEQPRDGVDGT